MRPRVRSLPREFQLAASCAMWPPSDHRTRAIRELASAPLDWERFLRIVMHHRIVGLAQEGLKHVRSSVPAYIWDELSSRATRLAAESLRMAAEAARLRRLF